VHALKTLGPPLWSCGAVVSEPQQICGEETRYPPWKNQVLFLLRWFVPDTNETSRLSGQRVRVSISRRPFDSLVRWTFSFFLRGLVTKVRLRTPVSNVFSVAEWLELLRYQWWCLDSVRGSWFKSAIKCRAQPQKNRGDPWNLAGCITSRLPRSRWIDLHNLTLTKYASSFEGNSKPEDITSRATSESLLSLFVS